jgi:hypothetical protein
VNVVAVELAFLTKLFLYYPAAIAVKGGKYDKEVNQYYSSELAGL